MDINKSVSKRTLVAGDVSHDFEKKLGICKHSMSRPYFINSFWSIGWADPFPDSFSNIDEEFLINREDLVYHKSRYHPDYCPRLIFIPSDQVLVKMMRACIAVDKFQDLWIYAP